MTSSSLSLSLDSTSLFFFPFFPPPSSFSGFAHFHSASAASSLAQESIVSELTRSSNGLMCEGGSFTMEGHLAGTHSVIGSAGELGDPVVSDMCSMMQ